MAFDDLEKREHKSFLQKHYAGARANIEQKTYGASLRRTMREWSKKLCTSFKGGGGHGLQATPSLSRKTPRS